MRVMVIAAEDRDLSEIQQDAADQLRARGGSGRSVRVPAEAGTQAAAGDGSESACLSRPGGTRSGDEAAPPPLTDATTAFLQAVRAHFVHFAGFVLEEIASRRWASVTFRGARHELAFRLEGEGAEEAAGRFLSGLSARDFALRGHLVADVTLVAEERRPGCARIRLEALTVEDG